MPGPSLSTDGARSVGRFGLSVVVMVVVAGFGLGLLFQHLLHTVEGATGRAARAERVVEAALRLDGLEWRAVAGEPLSVVQGEADEAAELLEASLPTNGGSAAADMRAAAADYRARVQAEFDALAENDRALAHRIDVEQVDPAFDLLLEHASALVAAETAASRATTSTTGRLAAGTVSFIVLAVTAALWVGLRQRDRLAAGRRKIEAARRFQSLVESSTDVVTVVSEERRLAVMSPTLGFLASVCTSADPTSVDDLVPREHRARWSESDALVRAGETVDALELRLTRHDGSFVDVELIGRLLAGEPGHRVWVWRDVSHRKTLEAELNRLAFHDSLTGIANRALFIDRTDHALHRAERHDLPGSVLVCDLDSFKAVNDTLGHQRGDDLLKVVSSRMAGCLRAGDTLARLGGDEFAVLLEDTDTDVGHLLADRILDAVCEQLELDRREIFTTMSIGIAGFAAGITTEELLRRADMAMYDAKRSGKGRAVVYRDDLDGAPADPLGLHTDLRQAINDGRLNVVYQPSVSLRDGSVSAVEALARWAHPTIGPIAPSTFVAIAEESGSIIALGKWVLTQACRAAVNLGQRDGIEVAMHVNLSPHQLNDPALVRFVKQSLTETGLDPALLVLEITEGALLTNRSSFDRLRELHEHGVRLAIDDFGTGYASITYLRRLPIDILKIDRTFVSGHALPEPERKALLHTIINLAQNLGLTTVAEGVETVEERDEVADLGCDHGQGFLWSKPVALDTLGATISELNSRQRLLSSP